MQTNKNIPYYITALGLFILLKFGYTLAENKDLTFLLKPTDKLVGLLTGSHSIYFPESGYYHEHLNIIIDKSCSGFNFWILCFLVFTYLMVKHFDKTLNKILTIPIAIIGAYLLTIFVNASRIFASIVVQTQLKNLLPNHQHILHEGIGIITNLTFLILAYLLIEKLLNPKQANEKFA
ncbi:MAG TPA: exosortase K [Edaphocola sp.]|nr:exosortase K [Edaphocola sp.]